MWLDVKLIPIKSTSDNELNAYVIYRIVNPSQTFSMMAEGYPLDWDSAQLDWNC